MKNFKAIQRMSTTTLGPIAVASSHFVVSLLAIPALTPKAYGVFAFCMVLIQFFNSITNAIAATPLSVLMNKINTDSNSTFVVLEKINNFSSFLFSVSIIIYGILSGVPFNDYIYIAMWGFLSGIRWFQRSYEFAVHRPARASICDVIYSVTLLISLFSLVILKILRLEELVICFMMANLVSIIFLLSKRDRPKRKDAVAGSIFNYKPIWTQQGGWALIGVVTTELTGNAHAYLVTLHSGPQAYAPIAIATLCWRPMATLLTSMTSAERPTMTKLLSLGNIQEATATLTRFRRSMLFLAGLNFVAVAALGLYFSHRFVEYGYEASAIISASSLWLIVVIMRCVRVPDSVFVQASGQFKELAATSAIAAPISVIVCLALIWTDLTVYSIMGIVIGELIMLWLVRKIARKIEA